MVEYSKVNVKLSNTQLEKLKTAAKNKTLTNLRMSLKMFGWKWSASWIIINNKTKKVKKYI